MLLAFWLFSLCLSSAPSAQAQSRPAIPQAHVTFTTIDVPGAASTNVYGINSAGHVTGNYSEQIGSPARGFSLACGIFSLFDYPGGDDTGPFGINDSDVISGAASVNNFTGMVSFLYDGTDFTTIQVPGESITWAFGINNASNVVGGHGPGGLQGFALVANRFKTISPPGHYLDVGGTGINNLRQIVGLADDIGFLYDHGKFRKIVVPGAIITKPLGINDDGTIVGWYEGCSPDCRVHGFALRNGKYLSLNYPGATETFCAGINNAGQIVGTYDVQQQTYHGFVTTPITASDFRCPPARA